MLKLQPTGTFHKQLVRCGKANCRCAEGKPHGPYWYLFYREHFVAWDELNKRRAYINRLGKIYIPKNRIKEATEQDKKSRDWPKLTLSLVRDLKRRVKRLSRNLEKASKNYDIKTAYRAENELREVLAYLRALNGISGKVNPIDSGKLDLAHIELGYLTGLTTFALYAKQSIEAFKFGLPKYEQ